MNVTEEMWSLLKEHLGYNDEEMAEFRNNPVNEQVLSKIPQLMNKTIVYEVVESHGCNSKHKVGDKFYLDGAGNLLTGLCPKRICIYALHSLAASVFASNELIYAGIDANEMKFKHVGCNDVGVKCGGWGHVVMKFSVEDRNKRSEL